ncbi:hypothetical protein [Acidovorax sp.]|uniref:hypothetical protein n=1 Tax=Acidovorax sp. TaxID=1872122 RepID=UPI003BB00E53
MVLGRSSGNDLAQAGQAGGRRQVGRWISSPGTTECTQENGPIIYIYAQPTNKPACPDSRTLTLHQQESPENRPHGLPTGLDG